MLHSEVLAIVLREMKAIGYGWRYDWNFFDGKTLRDQLYNLADWAEEALKSDTPKDYTEGTNFMEEQRL